MQSDLQKQLIALAKVKGSLTLREQQALAREAGITVRDLPLAWRGGLMGVFFGEEKKDGEG